MRNFLFHLALLIATIVISSASWAGSDEITPLKPLFTVSYEEAEATVGNALADKGAGQKISAHISGNQKEAVFSYGKPMTVAVRGLQFDKKSTRWSANLLALSEGEVLTAIPVSGRYDELTEVPVLKRLVRNGDVIAATDLEIRDVPVSAVSSDVVTSMGDLVGKSPVYTISPARPVRTHEVSLPATIKKNSVVQMRYHSPGMEITTSAQAMENGAKGSMINVKNIESKRIVQAMVVDAQTVSISPPTERQDNTKHVEKQNSLGEPYAAN